MSVEFFRILATIINFGILYLILRHFLFAPVNNTLSSRADEIAGRISKTKEDQKAAEALRKENEEKLSKAKEEGREIVENYKEKAEKLSDDIINSAKGEADLILERAKKEIEREKEKAKDEIKTSAVDLAILLSSKALESSIDEQTHRRLINDFITKVGV